MTEDSKRIEWLGRTAEEVEIHIRTASNGGSIEVVIGRITVQGLTVRAALDAAMKATTAGAEAQAGKGST